MQYKLEKSANGWRFELGNITTFITDNERKELIGALMKEDIKLIDRMSAYLESRGFKYITPLCLLIFEFMTEVEQFYGWKAK